MEVSVGQTTLEYLHKIDIIGAYDKSGKITISYAGPCLMKLIGVTTILQSAQFFWILLVQTAGNLVF